MQTFNEATVLALMVSARKEGRFAHPAIVQKGTNVMIDGFHRTEAVSRLAAEGLEIYLGLDEYETDDPAGLAQDINKTRRSWTTEEERRTQVQFLATQTDADGERFTNQQIADAVGTSATTVRRDKAHAPGSPDGEAGGQPPGGEKAPPVAQPATRSKGKDGKSYRTRATDAEKAKAWAMKDSGMSNAAIAKDLGRPASTVDSWFKKERPEAVAIGQPVMPAPEPEAKPQKPKVPDNLKKAHQREQKRIKERWLPIAEHLKAAHDLIRAEKERLCTEYAGAHGSLIMTRRWQDMAQIWAESGLLDQFAEITGQPDAKTLDGVLAELERSSRMANNWIKCMAIYTGCKPDLTRYQPEQSEQSPPAAEAAAA
jgi:hypothetical protein